MHYLSNNQNILDQLHSIEKKFGRSRGKRWDGRTLDLDLLAVGQSIQPSNSTYLYWHDLDLENQLNKIPSKLILPHPRMHERAFVLVPLLDIAPCWIHPVLKKNISELCNDLSVEEIEEMIGNHKLEIKNLEILLKKKKDKLKLADQFFKKN